jgi:hypothetical protein
MIMQHPKNMLGLTAIFVLMLVAILAGDGAFTRVTADTAGYALEFDGNNDLVFLAKTIDILGAGWESTKSLELWVRPLSAGSPCVYFGDCELVFGDQPRWWGVSQGVIGGLDRLWVWNADFTQTAFLDYIGVPYTPGDWVHITLVHAGGLLHVYQNGIEIGAVPSASTKQPTDGFPELRLGGMIKDATAWTFNGQIDEVRLWNFARTPAQVQADLYHELTGGESGLMAYYKMSDGSGLTLTDDSGQGWDGQLLDGYQNVPPDGSPPQWMTSSAFDLQPTFTPPPPTVTPTFTAPPPTATGNPLPTATATLRPTSTPIPGGTDLTIQAYLPLSINW